MRPFSEACGTTAIHGGTTSGVGERSPPWNRCCRKRRGLSTLEMVLSLPILLLVMALMVNYGTAASWKVRSLAMARHSLWSSLWPRTGGRMPRPAYWPSSAGAGAGGAGNVVPLDDPRLQHQVVRGPLPYGNGVREWLLDPSRGLRRGSSHLDRGYPMLGRTGGYHFDPQTLALNGFFTHHEMGLNMGGAMNLHNVRAHPITVIYELARADPALVNAYIAAVRAIYFAPFRPALRPLDRDDEFIQYAMRFGWPVGAPDFHPRLHQFCSLDHQTAAERVTDLVDRIQGRVDRDADGNVIRRVPSAAERIVQAFINLYQRVIDELQSRINADPPPAAGEMAAMQAEINDLQSRIDALTQFLQTLRNNAS